MLFVLLVQLTLHAFKMACANPKNQMLYQHLLNKVASYPASQPYKAKAYKKAAESIRNCPFDLRTKEHPEDIFFIGPSIAKYIKDFINHPCSISFCSTCEMATTPELDVPQCVVPANQPIYDALLNKAASYLAWRPCEANAYKKAAESVAVWPYDLRNDYALAVPNVDPSIAKYIKDFINHPWSISFFSTCQLADADETEEEEGETTLIPTCRKITSGERNPY